MRYAAAAITAFSQGKVMQLHEAFELTEMHSVGQANRAIQNDGWQLLAIAPGANGVTYVLGKKKPAASAQTVPLRV